MVQDSFNLEWIRIHLIEIKDSLKNEWIRIHLILNGPGFIEIRMNQDLFNIEGFRIH